MLSTRDLKTLPDINALLRLSQSLALLDAILSPEWEYRYYSFNSLWSSDAKVASMRNGSGDEYYIWFGEVGAAIKGFAHEAAMHTYTFGRAGKVYPGVLDKVPTPDFKDFLNEPAFDMLDTTFCIWRRYHVDAEWQVGRINFPKDVTDPDGSIGLLAMLDGQPTTYQAWAKDYYELEQQLELGPIQEIYSHTPLTQKLVSQLNSDRNLVDLAQDLTEIGYPCLQH
jgi:hypothetical protein